MGKFLEVKNLTVAYGREVVLNDVSFTLDEGATLAIIGPNGAGKTTLLRALIDSITYKGDIVWHTKPKLSYVPQRFEFDRSIPITVREFFLLHKRNTNFLFPDEEIEKEAKRALVHVNAHSVIDKRLGELSFGQLQRVLIAYALFGNPNCILFDEPTSGIDLEGQTTVYDLLEHLSKELKLTLILISHDLNVVYKFANTVICLNKSLVCVGSPQTILTPQQLEQLYGKGGFYTHNHA